MVTYKLIIASCLRYSYTYFKLSQHLKSNNQNIHFVAKWSSSDDIIGGKSALDETNLRDGPKIWAPGGAESGDDLDFKPVKFDSNSLKRTQKATVSETIYTNKHLNIVRVLRSNLLLHLCYQFT